MQSHVCHLSVVLVFSRTISQFSVGKITQELILGYKIQQVYPVRTYTNAHPIISEIFLQS